MDRREFVKSFVISAAAISCLSLTACGSDDDSSIETTGGITGSENTYNLAIICASRVNSYVNLSSVAGLEGELKKTIGSGKGFIAIVLADGAPQTASTTVELTSTDETRLKNEINDDVESVLGTDFSAQTEEADIYSALTSANKALSGAPDNGFDNLLVVIDSGVATKGAINFNEVSTCNALLNPDAFIDKLEEDGDLAEFSSIDKVVWFGMGEVTGSQSMPNQEGTEKAMERLYRSIFEAAGVDDVSFEVANSHATPDEGLPLVTMVSLPKVAMKDGEPIKLGDSLSFSEENSSLTFKFGTSEFNNPAAAKKQLQQYIDTLKDFPDYSVVIKGYTDSKGSASANQKLSKARAQSVANLFIAAGVKKKQIRVIGKGVDKDKSKSDKNKRHVEIEFE